MAGGMVSGMVGAAPGHMGMSGNMAPMAGAATMGKLSTTKKQHRVKD